MKINIFNVFDVYFLVLIVFNSTVAFFIDSSFYERKIDMKMKLKARVLSVINLISGIVLFIAGQMLGGI